MKKDVSYHDFIVYDLMSGWCIYSNAVPFAAIIGNQLYVKAKGEMAETINARGWLKFQYEKSGGKTIHMNYWLVPDEIIDDQDAFVEVALELLLSS